MTEREGVLALDLGGTVLKAAIVLSDGTVLGESRAESRERDGLAAWAEAAMDAARRTVASVGVPVRRIGLSVPGAVDPMYGVLVDLVKRIPEARDVRLGTLFSPLCLPVFADNDARAALAAEQRWGASRTVQSAVMLTVGTGLGGAVTFGESPPWGDPVLGGNQLGHFTMEVDGAPCVCGNRGCAETIASGSGLLRLAREQGVVVDDPSAVFAAARSGQPGATVAVARFRAGLAASVVNAIHAYQPELVILSGGVLQAAGDDLVPQIRRVVAERAWTVPPGRVQVTVSSLADKHGVLGAAAVALRGPTGPRERRIKPGARGPGS
jgi:glucokinase